MSEYSGFFNAETDGNGNYDRSYSAEQFAAYFSAFIGNGVYITPATQLQVFAKGDGVTIGIKPGSAYINGYFYVNDGTIYKTLTLPDGKNSRIDRVVIRLDLQTRTIALDVLEGIASLNPTVKNVTRNGSVYELALADIKVDKSVVKLSDEDITDLRNNNELCGYVHGVVDQIDTTEIFKQFQSAFDNWFANVKYTLDGDVAGKLQNQIDYNKQRIEFGTIDTTQSSSANDSVEGDLIVTDFIRNLLPISSVESKTINGVTFTNNGDGTWTLNGTATGGATVNIFSFGDGILNNFKGKKFVIIGTKGTNLETEAYVQLVLAKNGQEKYWWKNYSTARTIGNEADDARFEITVKKGYTCNNLIVKPMITIDLSAIYDDFVPYGYQIKSCGKNLFHPNKTDARFSFDATTNEVIIAGNVKGNGTRDSYINLNVKGIKLDKNKYYRSIVFYNGEKFGDANDNFWLLVQTNGKVGLSLNQNTPIKDGYAYSNKVLGSVYGGIIDEVTIVVRKNFVSNNNKFRLMIIEANDDEIPDFELYKESSIQITRDTPPVYGLKSFGGCTHIISPGNVKAVYPVNKAGADLIQSIKSNGEKIETLYSQIYGSGSDNGLLKRVGVLEKSKEYVDWLEEKCYPRDSVWFRTQIGNVRFLLDDFNMVSGVYMRTDNNFVVNHYGRLYPIEDNATTARAMQTYMILNTTKQITIPLTDDPSLKLFEVPKGPILRDLYRNDKQLSDVMSWSGACGGISANGCGAQINAKVDTESDANNIIVYIGTSEDSNAVLAKGAMIVVTAFSFGVQFKS